MEYSWKAPRCRTPSSIMLNASSIYLAGAPLSAAAAAGCFPAVLPLSSVLLGAPPFPLEVVRSVPRLPCIRTQSKQHAAVFLRTPGTPPPHPTPHSSVKHSSAQAHRPGALYGTRRYADDKFYIYGAALIPAQLSSK